MLIALVAAISLGMPFSASAQVLRGDSFVTESGDHSVEWNDNWIASLTSEDDFSTMVMLEGQIMIYSVMFMHDPELGLSERAIYHSLSGVLTSSFDSEPTHSVEWEDEDGTFHGAHSIPLSGIDFVIYMRVDPAVDGSGPTMQFAAAPSRAFPVSLDAMQEELSIDGVPVMDGADGEDVMARLNATTDDADASAESEAPAEESAPASNSARPTDANPRRPREAQIPAAESAGQEYVSASTGFTVTYPDSWTDMADSDSTVGEFSVDGASGRAVVSFTGRSTTETNRQAFFEDIEARESRYPGFVGSVIGEDRLLIATWTADNELAVLEYVFVDDSTVVTIMVTITSGNPERYVSDIQEIELDGTPILQNFDELWPED